MDMGNGRIGLKGLFPYCLVKDKMSTFLTSSGTVRESDREKCWI